MDLIDLIRNRKSRSELGYGILTADKYVSSVADCVGHDACRKYEGMDVGLLIKESSQKLTYSNEDMVAFGIKSSGDLSEWLSDDIELPPNTLMVFRHVLTTPRKDRDGDILRTGGATPDPKMCLLWQHIHTLPIGKMLEVVEHNDEVLKNVSAIIDIGDLAHDAAVMMANGMGRFSHGFRAITWEQLKEESGETTGPTGFDIKTFEIMEESIVSVPSNVDAQTEEILMTLQSRKEVKSDIVRDFIQKSVVEKRPLSTPGVDVPDEGSSSQETVTVKFGKAEITVKSGEIQEKVACSCDGKKAKADEKSEPESTRLFNPSDLDAKGRIPHGSLEGSWEWTQQGLAMNSRRYMELQSSVDLSSRFVWIVGTYPDNVIMCTEHERSMVPDEFVYWKVGWEMKDGLPQFTGDPTAIEVSVSLEEVAERSPLTVDKAATLLESEKVSDEVKAVVRKRIDSAQTKQGRVLSRTNMQKLMDVRDDLTDMSENEMTDRARGALCQRCVGKLSEVIRAAGGDQEDDDERQAVMSVKEAIHLLLTSDEIDLAEYKQSLACVTAIIERVETRREFADLIA